MGAAKEVRLLIRRHVVRERDSRLEWRKIESVRRTLGLPVACQASTEERARPGVPAAKPCCGSLRPRHPGSQAADQATRRASPPGAKIVITGLSISRVLYQSMARM
jgi:hypothetical protein